MFEGLAWTPAIGHDGDERQPQVSAVFTLVKTLLEMMASISLNLRLQELAEYDELSEIPRLLLKPQETTLQ